LTLASGFPPVAAENASVLILGSMPGRASLEARRYYAFEHNAFWRIMGVLFDAGPQRTYANRLQLLMLNRIALWDVLGSCQRPGSLDSAIDAASAVSNDFLFFFEMHASIRSVFFNGRAAADLFRRHVQPSLSIQLVCHTLPSTSPAYASMRFEQKLEAWKAVASARD
jgi:TDG/mug DNA glycosylase family protein